MNILPYKLATTNDQLTSRAGLLSIAQLMESISLADRVDHHLPLPKSNRGFKPSVFIQTLILMQHEGSFHLDDVRHLHDDVALATVLGLKEIPKASSLGTWLRRMGSHEESLTGLTHINKAIVKSALHHRKGVTLDIDATEIVAEKSDADWTYHKNKGFMPMVGHIAETGQVIGCDFRQGNASPARKNLEFIHQCQRALPDGCFIKFLRIDSAGYQEKIIKHCDENNTHYAIRAKLNATVKAQISCFTEADWSPMLNKKGEEIQYQETCRTSHCIGDYEKPFTLIVQRKQIKGQTTLDLSDQETSEEINANGYIYRAIATNQESWSDSQIIHCYNQRGEDSENRIKELKLDFGGDTLPCSSFDANALYFFISALSYNLFALMRQLLPEELASHRVTTLRWRLYAIAAKVVKTGRQYFVKVRADHRVLINHVLGSLNRFDPPPI